MSEKIIADALGLRPLEEIRKEESSQAPMIIEEINVPMLPSTVAQEEVIDDIELAKSNIKDIIEKGNDSLDTLLSLAKQGESARSYEVATTMMKILVDANKDYVAMSEKKKYAKEDVSSHQAAQTNVTNNNLILSTTELLKMLKGET